uniref:Uncharacterized protein n=1 Tax=Heterorhabditis bacteriophora TaxID=37862 RepID=A0A1I7X2L5_HETBA
MQSAERLSLSPAVFLGNSTLHYRPTQESQRLDTREQRRDIQELQLRFDQHSCPYEAYDEDDRQETVVRLSTILYGENILLTIYSASSRTGDFVHSSDNVNILLYNHHYKNGLSTSNLASLFKNQSNFFLRK